MHSHGQLLLTPSATYGFVEDLMIQASERRPTSSFNVREPAYSGFMSERESIEYQFMQHEEMHGLLALHMTRKSKRGVRYTSRSWGQVTPAL